MKDHQASIWAGRLYGSSNLWVNSGFASTHSQIHAPFIMQKDWSFRAECFGFRVVLQFRVQGSHSVMVMQHAPRDAPKVAFPTSSSSPMAMVQRTQELGTRVFDMTLNPEP